MKAKLCITYRLEYKKNKTETETLKILEYFHKLMSNTNLQIKNTQIPKH